MKKAPKKTLKPTKIIPQHPVQPLIVDAKGTIRFRANPLISFMLDELRAGRQCDLNRLSALCQNGLGDAEDLAQLWQLTGSTLSGFSELSFVSDELYARAANQKISK